MKYLMVFHNSIHHPDVEFEHAHSHSRTSLCSDEIQRMRSAVTSPQEKLAAQRRAQLQLEADELAAKERRLQEEKDVGLSNPIVKSSSLHGHS
jgi:hypothetical protein